MTVFGALRLVWRFAILALLVAAACPAVSATAAEPKIVGGSPVSIANHPYQVLVLSDQAGGSFQCGGSIRDSTHVVTAAHCVVDEEAGSYPQIVPPGDVEVGYSSSNAGTVQRVGVSRVSVAPGYQRDGTPASDAAVLTLAAPIDPTNTDPEANPIPFATSGELDAAFSSGALAFATGWGATSEGGSASQLLRGVNLPLRADSVCETEYGPDYDDSVMLCAGGTGTATSGNNDTCQGDSGGPLVIDTNPDPNVVAWELVGITSFGNGCGRPRTPGVYAWVQSSVLRPFLEAASPAAPPSAPTSNPTITGTLRVGQTVTCNAPPATGGTASQFLWYVVDGGSFTRLATTDAPTLRLPASAQGAFLVCDVRYESAGGFSYSDTPAPNRVGPVLAAAPPDTAITSGPSGTSTSSSATFEFSSTEAGSTFECKLDAAEFASCSSPRVLTGLSNGSHTFSVRAKDAAGNVDPTPATRTWTVNTTVPDTTPPDTAITAGPSGTIGSGSASFAFTSSEPGAGSSFECKLDGPGAATGSFVACSSPKDFSGLANGSYTFSVRAKDAAGNTDVTPANRTFTVATPPPDSDGDGVPNASDQCPTVAGPATRGGCPAPAAANPAPNPVPTVPATRAPSSVFSFSRRAQVKRRLTILTLRVPGLGVVKAAQAGTGKALIRAVRVTADAAGNVEVRIRPSRAGKRRLANKRSFTVRVKFTYTPSGGTSRSTSKRVKIKR